MNGEQKQTVSCMKCGTTARLQRIGLVVAIGGFTYCPVCGAKALAMPDSERDYWETLAEAYDLPVDLIQKIYKLWDVKEYQRFGDFVASIKEEVQIESVAV